MQKPMRIPIPTLVYDGKEKKKVLSRSEAEIQMVTQILSEDDWTCPEQWVVILIASAGGFLFLSGRTSVAHVKHNRE